MTIQNHTTVRPYKYVGNRDAQEVAKRTIANLPLTIPEARQVALNAIAKGWIRKPEKLSPEYPRGIDFAIRQRESMRQKRIRDKRKEGKK